MESYGSVLPFFIRKNSTGSEFYYYDNIPHTLPKKAYYRISNKYDYIDKEDINNYKINIYSMNDNLCKIIIRNNINKGWDNDIKINIYDSNTENKECISIGSSDKNSKIIDFYTFIKICKNIDNFSTTRKIIQIYESNKIYDYNKYLNFTQIIDLNTNIDYNFYNPDEQRIFIKNNCKSYLDIYDSLKNNDLKNMIFICNYLFLNGGFYVGLNINLKISISELYKKNKNIYLLNNNLLELLFCDKSDNILISYLNNLLNNNYSTTTLEKLFNKYVKLEYDSYNILNNNFKINYDDLYFQNIIILNEDKFIIVDGDYNKDILSLEYLNLNYYSLNLLNNFVKIDNNITIICYTKINKKKIIKLSEMKKFNIKNEIKYIFSTNSM
jgi:hypothetical protein